MIDEAQIIFIWLTFAIVFIIVGNVWGGGTS